MESTRPLPQRLTELPVCPRRGLPVPYTNLITGQGDVDFATLDSAKVHQVALNRLCGVCGRPLDYWIVFVGGPRCVDSRAYLDPPMHEDCARATLRLCPYLARETMRRRKTPTSDATTPPGFVEDKPASYLLYVTRSYTYIVIPDGVIFHPAPAKRLEEYRYIDGRLTPPG
jgi:hypothetical protein